MGLKSIPALPLVPRARSHIVGYAVAVAGVAVAYAIRLALAPWLGDDGPFLLFLPAVIVAGHIGGRGPAAVAALLGAAAGLSILFSAVATEPPRIGRDEIHTAVYLVAAGLMTVVCGALHGARQQFRDRAAALEEEASRRQVAETDLRRRADDLATSERRFRDLADAMPAIVWMADAAGRLTFLNRGWVEYTGHADRDNTDAVMHPDDRAIVAAEWAAARAAGRPFQAEYRLLGTDGRFRWFLGRSLPTRDEGGRGAEWFGAATDIDALKTAQADLRATEERFRLAAEAINGIIYDWDRLTESVVRSRGLFEVTGYHPHEVPADGRWWRDQIHPDDREPAAAAFHRQADAGADRGVLEYRVRHRDGTYRHLVDRSLLIRDTAGSVVRQVGCTIDVTERKAAEERFYKAFHTNPVPMAITAVAAGRYVDANAAFMAASGYERTEVIGRRVTDLNIWVDPADRDRLLARLEGGERVAAFETTVRVKSGAFLRLLMAADTIDVAGEQCLLTASFDITGRKKTEDALARYRLLSDHARDIVLFVRPADGRIIEANAAAAAAYGYGRDELLAIPYLDLHASDAPPPMTEQRAANGGATFETVHRRRDGTPFPVEVSAQAAEVGGERLLLCVARDVTDRKRAEEALRRTNALVRAVNESTPTLVFVKDRAGRFLYANPATLELLDRPAIALLGTAIEDEAEETRREIHATDRDVMQSGESRVYEEAVPVRGIERIFRTTKTPHRDANGQVIGLIGVSTDITDLKRSEAALQEADRRKNDFLATLAHELRNPLAPVRSAIEVLKTPGLAVDALARCRDTLNRQITHLSRLVDDLMDVSRITRGKLQLRPTTVDLRATLEHAIEIGRPLLDARQHQFSFTPPAHPIILNADSDRLAQIVSNLLNNAAKYTPEGGDISLVALTANGGVEIRVRDTGMGLSPEQFEKVFEPFAQLDHSLERAMGGLGIGLSLVKTLTELHGGTVRAASHGPGRGTEMTVWLPAPTPLIVPAAPATDRPAGPICRKVLVVDDNVDAADSLAMLAEIWGHDVQTANDGPTAIRKAASFRPDIVLLDIGMPLMNGFEVARHLRAESALDGVVLAALTGWGQDEDRDQSRAAGFDLHLVKPLDPAILERLLADPPQARSKPPT